ncbi:MAG: hypothetical protein ACXQTL_00020 [Methanosarcinales archaeon]
MRLEKDLRGKISAVREGCGCCEEWIEVDEMSAEEIEEVIDAVKAEIEQQQRLLDEVRMKKEVE